ncbi:DUF6926 domain-containing protein [Prevotella bivia]
MGQISVAFPDIEGNMQPYFTHVPAFGLPTEVEDCTLICRE